MFLPTYLAVWHILNVYTHAHRSSTPSTPWKYSSAEPLGSIYMIYIQISMSLVHSDERGTFQTLQVSGVLRFPLLTPRSWATVRYKRRISVMCITLGFPMEGAIVLSVCADARQSPGRFGTWGGGKKRDCPAGRKTDGELWLTNQQPAQLGWWKGPDSNL